LSSTFIAPSKRTSDPSVDSAPAISDSGDRPAAIPQVWSQLEAEIPYLRRAVRRWCRDPADAGDLVQDTLIRALSSAHLWEPGTNLRAWLLTIMRNQFFSNVAKNRRTEIAGEALEIAGPGGSGEAESRLILRDVERAVRRLPPKQRSAVLLAGVDGKSYSEVAILMGISVDAVRCHLARARDGLRTAVYRRDERTWAKPSS
jgi:RNA polymerase sigma-70 factor (ECF subfamily)